MGAEVHTSAQFGLTPERLAELRAAGASVHDPDMDLKLAPPGPNETVVGTLEDDEVELYHLLHNSYEKLQERDRFVAGERMKKLGEQLQSGEMDGITLMGPGVAMDPSKFPREVLLTEEENREYSRLVQLHTHLHALFHWTLGERFDQHQNRLGIRDGLRVVVVRPRQ